ncbi:MAG: hypothetical protein AAF483_01710 [Planctomycetota bacterium]
MSRLTQVFLRGIVGIALLVLLQVGSYLDLIEQQLNANMLRIAVVVAASSLLLLSRSWVLAIVSAPFVYWFLPAFVERLTWGQAELELQMSMLALFALLRFGGLRICLSTVTKHEQAEQTHWRPGLKHFAILTTVAALGLGFGQWGSGDPAERSALVWFLALSLTGASCTLAMMSHLGIPMRIIGSLLGLGIGFLTLMPVQSEDQFAVYLAMAGILTHAGWCIFSSSLLWIVGWRSVWVDIRLPWQSKEGTEELKLIDELEVAQS